MLFGFLSPPWLCDKNLNPHRSMHCNPLTRLGWTLCAALLALVSSSAAAIDLLVYNTNSAGAGSLWQAVADNNALGGSNTIVFSSAVRGTIQLTVFTSTLGITKDVEIVGPGPDILTVSGTGQHSVFRVGDSRAKISGLTLINGQGQVYGGGIDCSRSTLTVSNCTLRANSGVAGGGVFFDAGNGTSNTLAITRCTFVGNGAYYSGSGAYNGTGGGICIAAANSGSRVIATVEQCTFANNSAVQGGGIYCEGSFTADARLTVRSCTLSGNTANFGGCIFSSGQFGGNATVEVQNTIFKASSTGVTLANDRGGVITSRGYNLSSDYPGVFLSGVGDQVNTDPLIGSLQNNGGPTPTIAPLPGSPAIDQGLSADLITDQRGRPRPFTNAIPAAILGDHSDIGAVELNYFPGRTVLNTNDSGEGSLRLAILEVTNRGAINFASDVTGTITLTNGELLIGNSLSVLGPCANHLTISGNDSSRVFNIPAGVIANLSGLTIAHGSAVVPNYGGGIQNNGTLTLTNCVLTANSATTTNGSDNAGGAILNDYPGALTLNGCTISGNFSQYGGALYNHGALTALDTTISANSSSVASTIYSSGSLLLNSCTIVSNNAAAGGGGFQNDAGFAALGNSIVAGNRTTNNASPDVFATVVSLGYNLIGTRDGSVGLTNGFNNDQVGSIASPLNPALGPLTDNGGCTPTHRLLSGSPAIDKGKKFGFTTDQRGAPRPFEFAAITNASGGDGSDIGAFELGSPHLAISRAAANLVLSWPAHYGDFALESLTNLTGSSNWTTVSGKPILVGDQYNITNSVDGGSELFRLRGK